MSKRQRTKIGLAVDGVELNVEPGEDVDAPAMEHVSLHRLEREYGRSDERCWGCERFRRPQGARDPPALHELWGCMEAARGRIPLKRIAQQMREIFVKRVFEPSEAFRKSLPADDARAREPTADWPEDMIYVHLRRHMNTDELVLEDRQRKILTQLDVLDRITVQRGVDDKNNLEVNDKAINAQDKLTRLLLVVMQARRSQ